MHIAGRAGLALQRHKALYGTTDEQFGMLAVGQREWAQKNPNAIFRTPLTMDDYLAEPYMVEPLRRSDVTMISDGGVSFVVTTAERAADLPNKPVYVIGIAEFAGIRGEHNPDNLIRPWLADAAREIWGKTGLGPRDIDALYIQDPTAVWSCRCSSTTASAGWARVGRSWPRGTPFPAATCRSTRTAASCRRATRGAGCISSRPSGNCAGRPAIGSSTDPRRRCTAPVTASSRRPPRSCRPTPRWARELQKPSPVDDPWPARSSRPGERRRLVQKCDDCDALRWPPLPGCPECCSRASTWTPVAPTGTIWSYVVYHRAFHPGFQADLPYAVGLVENADGVRYTGRVVGRREDVAVGAKVRAVFADETPEFTLVKWELA